MRLPHRCAFFHPFLCGSRIFNWEAISLPRRTKKKRRNRRILETFCSFLYLLQDDSGSADLVSCDFHPDPSVYAEHSPEWMGLMAALLAVVWHGI